MSESRSPLPEAGSAAGHWDAVFTRTSPEEVSWFEADPSTSLDRIDAAGITGDVAVDIGAGRSPLAALLLQRGWSQVIAVDISAAALQQLAEQAGHPAGLACVVSDVLAWAPERQVSLWHDRAVFHFLVDPDDQAAYAALAARTVEPGGIVIMATFAPDGPVQCSGLPTARHDADSISAVLGPAFALVDERRIEHRTPWGAIQPFTWATLRRLPIRA